MRPIQKPGDRQQIMTLTKLRSFAVLLVAIGLVGAFTVACTGQNASPTSPSPGPAPAPTPSPAPVVLTRIAINGPGSIQAGKDAPFTLTATYSDGTTTTPSGAAWTSSDPRILGVSASGTGSAIASGVATVTAMYQSKSATVQVTVTAPAPPPVNIAGLWRMTMEGAATRSCPAVTKAFDIRLEQTGASITGSDLKTAPGGRPLPIVFSNVRFSGTVQTGGAVTFSITFTETLIDVAYPTNGVFAGTVNSAGTTIAGSFDGTTSWDGGRGGSCQYSAPVIKFTRS
jgi:hypothetical protein